VLLVLLLQVLQALAVLQGCLLQHPWKLLQQMPPALECELQLLSWQQQQQQGLLQQQQQAPLQQQKVLVVAAALAVQEAQQL
jgi:hypothetical protein